MKIGGGCHILPSMNTRTPFVVAAMSLIAGLSLACGGLEDQMNEIAAQGEIVIAEGESFGMSSDQEGCMTASLDRAAACTGGVMEKGTCQGMAQVYLQGCLNTAAASAGFCDGAPAPEAIMDTVNWGIAQCEAAGRSSEQSCANVQQTRAEWCNQG